MRASTIWQALLLPTWRYVFTRWPWLALVWVISSAVLGVVLLIAAALTIVILPLWGILFGVIERWRIRMLGAPRRPSGHVRVPGDQRHNWLTVRLTEPATWRETAALLAGIVFGVFAFGLIIAQAAAIGLPVALAVAGFHRGQAQVTFFFDLQYTAGPDNWWHPLPWLLVVLYVFAYVDAAFAALHASVIGWLIAPRHAEIDRRIEQLTRSRAAVVAAHEGERRRIERDLHDGVQQELVGIAARLGILELELTTSDRDAATKALRDAQDQTERALRSLRETVRGIHPAVLTDHGLTSALEELAGRSALALRIHDTGFPRLAPAAEAAGYFLVAEAMTNSAKHSDASRVTAELGIAHGAAYVAATDDGHGGADAARGSGLAGLAGRAESLGGSLTITSPAGGPTVLRMELPLTTAREGAFDAHPARR